MLGQLDSYIQNNHPGLFSIPCTNISLKWIKDSIRTQIMKLLEENIEHSLTLVLVIFFLVSLLRQGGKTKINKWNYIKLAQRRKLLTK